ncbi:neurotransmitter-gated ion-channel ligand binding domain-containing protein [Phthorimaea operculella]|nr:neurotransmitter-gated ion-channel ligand binding domain-containing protein [Phthorimaea operculella]
MSLVTWILLLSVLKLYLCENCLVDRYGQINDEEKIRKHLIKDCELTINRPPNTGSDKPVKVFLNMRQLSFSFDEQKETIYIQLLLFFNWIDTRLMWKPKDYGGIESVSVSSKYMWTPLLRHYNAKQDDYYDVAFPDFDCEIIYQGSIFCSPRNTYDAPCSTDLSNWPFDVQQCNFDFGNWDGKNTTAFKFVGHDRERELEGMDPFDAYNSAGWQIYSFEVVDNGDENKIEQLTIVLNLKRVAEGLASTLFIPVLLSCLLTIVSFMLRLDNNRLLLSCLSLQIHFWTLLQISYEIPKHSSDSPSVLLFLRMSTVLTSLSIVLTLHLKYILILKKPISLWMKSVLNFVQDSKYNKFILPRWKNEDTNTSEENEQVNWFDYASVLNHFCLCLFVLLYLILLVIYIPRVTNIVSIDSRKVISF